MTTVPNAVTLIRCFRMLSAGAWADLVSLPGADEVTYMERERDPIVHCGAHLVRIHQDRFPTRADSGDREAGERLGWWLAEHGDDAALAELRDRTDAGDREAAESLAVRLAKQGDRVGAMQVLQPLADAHEPVGSFRLADLLIQQGDQSALAELRDGADTGNWDVANRLATLLANQGDTAGLRRELYAGNTRDATDALVNLYAAEDPERRRQLTRYGLTVTGLPTLQRHRRATRLCCSERWG